MNTLKPFLVVVALMVFVPIVSPSVHVVVHAETPQENCENATSETFLGLPTWYKYLETEFEDGNCKVKSVPDSSNPGQPDIGATVGAVIFAVTEILLRVAGVVAVGFIVYGGILYTISQGEPERLGAARKTIINGIIGLVIAVFAVAIVNLLTNVLLP